MSSDPLKDKIGVLYVLKDDPKSDNALKFARAIPEIYIQYVNLLPIEQIPKWLKDAPTFVTMENKKIKQLYPGTEAFEVLYNLYTHRKSSMETFTMPPPIQTIPYPNQQQQQQQTYQMQQMQQMQHAQNNRMPYPTQQQSQQPLRPPFPENSRGVMSQPPPPPYPPQFQPQPRQQIGQQMGQQMGQQRKTGEFGGDMDAHPGSLKFSSQPSTGGGSGGGTVQYGCSIDMAFLPIEDAPVENESQYRKGKVDQRDLEMYQRMREQSGSQGNSMGMLQ